MNQANYCTFFTVNILESLKTIIAFKSNKNKPCQCVPLSVSFVYKTLIQNRVLSWTEGVKHRWK